MANQVSKQPNEAQLHASQQCSQSIKSLIQEQGEIGFDEFMQIALFDPDYGYYQRKDEIFGALGDFTTVPETSDHLAFCLAHAALKIIQDNADTVILEIGAGSGKLCCEILKKLSDLDSLPERYYIYETSAALRGKQQALIAEQLPDYIENVHWLDDFSNQIGSAMIIANEVLDALPVHCFQVDSQQMYERVVKLNDADEFVWSLKKPNEKLAIELDAIANKEQPFADGYQSEINSNLSSSLASWSSICHQCVTFIIDYGYPRHEYYHPQRNMGTLRSYFKHQVSEDVFAYPGLQDITADVDFTAVANAASELDLNVLAFSSQRNFMLANNLVEWQPNADSEVERLAQIAQLKQLTLGSAISERFQVIVLGKEVECTADQFTLRDMRARL